MPTVERVATVPASFEAVRAVAEQRPVAFLTGIDQSESTFDVEVLGFAISRRVRVQPGTVTVVDAPISAISYPFQVEAAEHDRWMPLLEAEIEVTRAPRNHTEVALVGRYEVPGGWIGAIGDTLMLHRAAEEAIDGFFDRLVARVTRWTASVIPPHTSVSR